MIEQKQLVFFDYIGTYGGAQQSTVTLLNELNERYDDKVGVKAVIVNGTNAQFLEALSCEKVYLKTPSLFGFSVFRVGRSYIRLAIYYFFCIYGLLKAGFSDRTVYLCNSGKALVALAIFKLISRRKIIINYYCRGWGQGKDFSVVQRFLLRHFVSKVFCVSTQTKNNLLGFISAEKLRVVYTSVKLSLSSSEAPSDIDFFSSGSKKNILFAGAVIKNKGLHIILKSLSKIYIEGEIEYSLYIAGNYDADPQYRDFCKAIIEENNLGSVFWLGWRKDVQSIVSKVDIVCLPSVTEGMPRIIQEAMFYSKIAVATNVGGVADLIEDNETGFIIARNEDSLSAVLKKISNGNYNKDIGINARSRFLNKFHIDKQVGLFVEQFCE